MTRVHLGGGHGAGNVIHWYVEYDGSPYKEIYLVKETLTKEGNFLVERDTLVKKLDTT